MKNFLRKSVSPGPCRLYKQLINTPAGFSQGFLKSHVYCFFCDQFLFRSDDLFLWPRGIQGLFPCSCSDEKKNSINKIRLHRRGMSCCYGNPPYSVFSPESRSFILDATDAGESDLAGLGKWQTDKTLVTVGNPERVSRPDGIYTVYAFLWELRKLSKMHLQGGKHVSRGWCKSIFYAFASAWWADRNRCLHVWMHREISWVYM